MSEGIHEHGRQTDVATPESTYAVGFVASEGNSEPLARAILRAKDQGYEVFVTNDGECHGEALHFAESLGATVVELRADEPDNNALRQRLAIAAEKRGCSNILVNLDVTDRVDYGRSERLLEEDEFCVDAATYESALPGHDTDNILVAIPAYNEELAIGSTIHKAQQYAPEVVVVDDGSSDSTAEVARRAGATVIKHEENKGKGAAIQTILDFATRDEWEATVLLDGDGQHLPEDIPAVVDPVLEEDADMVIGSRYLETDGDDETPLYRRFGQQVLDVLTTGSSGAEVTDSQSGFRALSSSAVEEMHVSTNGIGVESEMINDAAEKNIEMTEVPIDVRYDGIDGQTYNPLHHGLSVVVFLVQLVRDRHPLVFFGIPGAALLLFGVMYGLDGILIYQNSGVFYPAKVLVAGFASILGTLGVFAGLVLNQTANMLAEVSQ